MEPAVCTHRSACRKFDVLPNNVAVFAYACAECAMEVAADTWEDARCIFWLRAEKIWVRHLLRRRKAGETLTEREQQMIGHSPFGDANTHNF